MKINDLDGREIALFDLELALSYADDYRHYKHADMTFAALDECLQAYWEDMYRKLLKLKSK